MHNTNQYIIKLIFLGLLAISGRAAYADGTCNIRGVSSDPEYNLFNTKSCGMPGTCGSSYDYVYIRPNDCYQIRNMATKSKYQLTMQADGDLVISGCSTADQYCSTASPLWHSHTAGHPGAYAEFNPSYSLDINDASGKLLTTYRDSRSDTTPTNLMLVFNNHGYLLIYDDRSKKYADFSYLVWTSNWPSSWQSGSYGN